MQWVSPGASSPWGCAAHSGLVLSFPLGSAAFAHKETHFGEWAPLSAEFGAGWAEKRPLVVSPQQSRLFLFLNFAMFFPRIFLTQSEDDFFFVTDYLNYTGKWKLIQNSTKTANNCYCFKHIPFRHLSWPISILLLALDVIYYSGFVIWMQNMWIFSCFPLVCRFITTFPISFWCIIFIIIQFQLFFNCNCDLFWGWFRSVFHQF